jgi:hypothetical protein
MSQWNNLKDDPLTPEELQRVRLATERTEESWPIIGPMVAALRNWKAWLFAAIFVAWINRPEIVAAITALIGGR